MTVQSITVRISDGIKTVDYAPPKLYDLTALVVQETPSSQDDIANEVTAVIRQLQSAGDAFLGRTAAPVVSATAETAPKRTRATPNKAKDPAAVEDEPGPQADVSPSTPAPAKADPAAVVDEEVDFDADIPPAETVKEITDAELNAAAQKANADTSNQVGIRELIASYNPDPTKPFNLRQIPGDKRPDFIAKLKDVKKLS